jgi:gamma-glutamyltranspeptidase/glutathione hydrolase
VQALRDAGHSLRAMPLTSGLQVLRRVRVDGVDQWQGGSDPRREGVVLGQ